MRPQIFTSSIPVIAISPAPLQYPPSPPETEHSSEQSVDDYDLYRSVYLTPPPTRVSYPFASPPKALKSPANGLEPVCFESLLQASRERSAVAAKRNVDLRKEVALKAHKTKQDERRARFLAKVGAPPSPSATHLPVTPPESPALFHFTLPSPGLVSPLALFESLGTDTELKKADTTIWVEQVEFQTPRGKTIGRSVDVGKAKCEVLETRRRSLPSLEDISYHFRMNNVNNGNDNRSYPANVMSRQSRPPLPAFLYARKPSPATLVPADDGLISGTTCAQPRVNKPSSQSMALTEANLMAFEQRARAITGLNTLKRRLSPDDNRMRGHVDDKRERRYSAPSQLPASGRGRGIANSRPAGAF